MTSLDLDEDRVPEPCLIDGCAETRAEGMHCQAHADWLAHRDTPAARAIHEQFAKRAREKIDHDIAEALAKRVPTGQAAIICPHCQIRGKVTSRIVRQKKGISGGKATGALLTGGLSLLGTGLSRKERATEMHCRNCNTQWVV